MLPSHHPPSRFAASHFNQETDLIGRVGLQRVARGKNFVGFLLTLNFDQVIYASRASGASGGALRRR
jgi:hypothetical protein